MSKYIGNIPVPNATQSRTRIVATSGQTTFTTSASYTPGYIDVFLGGVKLDSSEFTATNGTTVVLASGANTGQIFESISYTTYNLDSTVAPQTGNAGKYLTTDGTNTSWADVNTTEAATSFKLKSYTTTQRDALTDSEAGDIIFNTTTGVLEVYGGEGWYAPHAMSIDSVTGYIAPGVASTLSFTGTGLSSTVDIRYYEGATLLATSSSVAVSSGAFSDTVPSAVYGQDIDDVITIKVVSNGAELFAGTKTVEQVYLVATGGTVTTDGNYKIHTFTSSGTFTVTQAASTAANNAVEYIVVAGGGGSGGGWESGGGGAGGYRSSVVGESSGGGSSAESKLTVSAQAYTVTVGAAGAAGAANSTGSFGGDGGDSTFATITSTGGGGGGGYTLGQARSGGSGGGAASDLGSTGGSGTSGQGYAGGSHSSGTYYAAGCGGGGAGQAGQSNSTYTGGDGGDGVQSSINGTATYRAGGGGGATYHSAGGAGGVGGLGGGGNGDSSTGGRQDGTVNTGGGGGGERTNSTAGAAGGSGIVIIRYQYQ